MSFADFGKTITAPVGNVTQPSTGGFSSFGKTIAPTATAPVGGFASFGRTVTPTVAPTTTANTFTQWTGIQNPTTYWKDSWNQLTETIKHPIQAVKNVFGAGAQNVTGTLQHAGTDIGEAFKTEGDNWAKNTADIMNALGASASVVFLPMTTIFAAADKLPVLKQAADVVNAVFTTTGRLGEFLPEKFIDALPIAQVDKDVLRPAFGEIGALAGQIVLGGKVMHSLSKGMKVGKKEITKFKEEAIEESNTAKQTVVPEVKPEAVKPVVESPLAQEATKYKSAEEFVQGIQKENQAFLQDAWKTYYHGTPVSGIKDLELRNPFQDKKYTLDSISFGYDKSTAETYATNFGKTKNGEVIEAFIKPNKSLEVNKIGDIKKLYPDVFDFSTFLKEQGYDSIKTKNELVVLDKSIIKTKSQLTDIYNQAVKTAPEAPKVELPKVSESKIEETGKVAKAATDINKTLAETGFETLAKDELAQYRSLPKEAQIERLAQILTDKVASDKMATTGEGIPGDVRAQALFNAVKIRAMREGNVELQRALAKSSIASARSIHAAELGAAGFENKIEGDPVEAMIEINKVRKKAVVDKFGEKRIKEEISKTKIDIWEEFQKLINC